LGDQCFIGVSFDQSFAIGEITGIGAVHFHKSFVLLNFRFAFIKPLERAEKYQAIPQIKSAYFCPRSRYGVVKLCTHWMAPIYRESYEIFPLGEGYSFIVNLFYVAVSL
jgi:GDPmannose 4,6-dehydratase